MYPPPKRLRYLWGPVGSRVSSLSPAWGGAPAEPLGTASLYTHAHTRPRHWSMPTRGMPAPGDTPACAQSRGVCVLALLPHPIQACLRSIPALLLGLLTSCLGNGAASTSWISQSKRNPSGLPAPAPFPASRTEDWLRHWDATGERFFLHSRLRGRGHTAAFGDLGWRVTRRNLGAWKRRRPRALGPPLPLPPTFPLPMHFLGNVVCSTRPQAGTRGAKPRIPGFHAPRVGHIEAANHVPGACDSAEQRRGTPSTTSGSRPEFPSD